MPELEGDLGGVLVAAVENRALEVFAVDDLSRETTLDSPLRSGGQWIYQEGDVVVALEIGQIHSRQNFIRLRICAHIIEIHISYRFTS